MNANVSTQVLQRIEQGGERFWRFSDFQDLPVTAVAKALSRLKKTGRLQRLSKGIYYCPRQTAFGSSRPNLTSLQPFAAEKSPIFPAGLAAAGLLGFTTQVAKQSEVSTVALSLPRKLLGQNTIIHRARPAAWLQLEKKDAAMLELLRSRAQTSELSPEATVRLILSRLSDPVRFGALMKVAFTEPPRVRAMLGAIGQQLRKPKAVLFKLRASLNPLSKFDFGVLAELEHSKSWYARAKQR